jgi:hypothetical protein
LAVFGGNEDFGRWSPGEIDVVGHDGFRRDLDAVFAHHCARLFAMNQ